MQSYFLRIPNTFYNKTECKDITRRAKLEVDQTSTPYVFYPYEIQNQLRSDQVAEFYYNDSEMDWLIYLSNGIIDPYYGWYLDENKFNTFVAEKYGSIETAIKTIKFYRNNWASDSTQITPSYFENTLPFRWKRYYSPVFGANLKIISYARKQVDHQINTNRILQYNITYNSDKRFQQNEVVDIKTPSLDQPVGTGQVTFSNNTVLQIQSVSGETNANTSSPRLIVGETSKANVTTSFITTITENITNEEEVFWTPISMYEYEREVNESRKLIRLVGDSVSSLVVNEFTENLQSDG